jgi:4-diphosphocytidyl-2-C-methyl-D-erythritol kinase
MVTLDLADTLMVTPGEGLTITGRGADALSTGPDNLVQRALRLVGRQAAVHVDKVIPSGGGLGGGSADAAAILRWAGFSDMAQAATLGGDVPFCVRGGRAMVTGIGDVVDPLDYEPREVTLFVPDFGVNTAACYRAFDELVAGGWSPQGRNNLTDAAVAVEPRLGRLLAFVEERTGRPAILAGSGSTVFVEGHLDVTSETRGPDGRVEMLTAVTTPNES